MMRKRSSLSEWTGWEAASNCTHCGSRTRDGRRSGGGYEDMERKALKVRKAP